MWLIAMEKSPRPERSREAVKSKDRVQKRDPADSFEQVTFDLAGRPELKLTMLVRAAAKAH